jgi:hypothetical protein
MRIFRTGRRAKAMLAVLVTVAALPLVGVVASGPAGAATPAAGDGTSEVTAGASCWGIKQQHPSSANGVYWLNTPALERPTQFYCDMTTDGGGWVMVGRGRQGWTFSPNGQGSATTLRNTPDGTAAFSPAALPSTTIDALLGGGAVSNLVDGIRVERAANSTGTTRQDVRMHATWARWNWNLPAGQLLNRISFDSQTYQGSNTKDTGDSVYGQTTNQASGGWGSRRLFTYPWSSHNNQRGFSYGSSFFGGSSSSTNFLWTYRTEGSPIPFSRVFIRPRIANGSAGFTPIPAAGYPAEPKPQGLDSRSKLAPWGVVGMDRTGETTIEPWNTNVLSLRAAGDRVFMGGRFTGAQQGPGATPVPQPFLAAFDLDGNFIDTFRPQVNGRVWDMVVADDGKLIIAGDFTSVNGDTTQQGIAKLDPVTGALVPGFKAQAYYLDGSRAFVRGLSLKNGIVYAVGNFNRFQGGTWNPITVTRAISFSAATGTPGTWRPRLSGQPVRVRASDDATRVYIVGYFNNINGDTNHAYFGITDLATGVPVPGMGPWRSSIGTNRQFQQAVDDVGDKVIVGGSEHNIQLWNRDRTQLLDASVTRQGGDTQAIEQIGDKVYIGCHCGDWVYQGANTFPDPTGFRAVEDINLVGAFDVTGNQLNVDNTFNPTGLKGASGEGVWAIDSDDRDCLWVGGDLNRGAYSGNAATDFLGGFARFCSLDSKVPTTPTNLTHAREGAGTKLTWGASTDESGTVSYDVYKDDRVIAKVWNPSFVDPNPGAISRYTVRAVDARGNRSASPAPVTVAGASPVVATPVSFASTWKYLDTGADQGAAWRDPSFDDAAWPSGPGRLGWGRTDIATTIGATKPLTAYFRRSFNVADPAVVRTLDLQLYVATGAVVYLNGTEVGRINMPDGAIGATTPAAGYVSGTVENAIKPLTVPSSLLRAGTNTLSVEVHNVTAGASRLMFDLQATLFAAGADSQAPTAPTLTGTRGANGVSLSWTPGTDDIALGGYLITRDGMPIASTGSGTTSFIDTGVDITNSHTYRVSAFDTNANSTPSNEITIGGQANPNLMAFGSSWRWFYAEGGPSSGWASSSFDDSTWAAGLGELGYGDSDERTLISTSPTPRPLTAYFRTTVDVPNPGAFSSVLAELIRDDGAVVYVNGVEVGRTNMPTGPIAFSTPASSIISDRTAERTPVAMYIPASAFVPGTNVIAVEVHNSDRWSGDLSMDLKLTGQS